MHVMSRSDLFNLSNLPTLQQSLGARLQLGLPISTFLTIRKRMPSTR